MEDVLLAERSLVAVLALQPARIGEVSGWLSASDFGSPPAGLLFERLIELDRAGRREPTALLDLLRDRGELRRDGYPLSSLMRWWDAAPAPGHVAAYGRLVVEGHVARLLATAGVRLEQVASRGGPARVLPTLAVQRALLTAAHRRLASVPDPNGDGPGRPRPAPLLEGWGLRPVPAELEQAELITAGSVVLSPAAARVGRWLTGADFASVEVGEVFAAAMAMRASSRPVDRVTVTAELRRRASAADAALVARCEASVPVTTSVGFYARRVLSASVSRQVAATGKTLVHLGEQRPGGTSAAVASGLVALDGLSPLACRVRIAFATTPTASAAAADRVLARRSTVEAARR